MSLADVFKSDIVLRENASVANHYLPINNTTDREVAEELTEKLISLEVVFFCHFSLESIHHG